MKFFAKLKELSLMNHLKNTQSLSYDARNGVHNMRERLLMLNAQTVITEIVFQQRKCLLRKLIGLESRLLLQ